MTTLAQYERARASLAEATRIDEVLSIHDEVEHIKLYAKQIKDQALLADASEFQMRVERRLGTVIQAAKDAGEIIVGRPKKVLDGGPFPVRLQELGVSKNLSSRSQQRASISERAFEAAVQGMRERVAAGKAKIIDAPLPGGARSIMGDRQEPDDSLDYFPTPPWATRALMERVLPRAWGAEPKGYIARDPACGEGHISEVLKEYFGKVYAEDIHDYGAGSLIFDFLVPAHSAPLADWIITNPPFGDRAIHFVLKALDLFAVGGIGVAMFFRSQWAVEGIERYEKIFRDHPPTLFAPFVERVPLCKGEWNPHGTTATAYCWLVWVKGRDPLPPFWIPPTCRKELTRPDDIARFAPQYLDAEEEGDAAPDPETGEIAA